MSKKKILRVITDGRVLPWHLEKTLIVQQANYEIYIAGECVSNFKSTKFNAVYIDLPLTPKINLWKDVYSLFLLFFITIKIRPDIVHSIMPKAGLLTAIACFFTVPIRIHTFTGQVWQTKNGLSRFLLKALDNLIVRLNTKCLTDSFTQSNFLRDEGISCDSQKPLPVLCKGSLGGVDLDKIDLNLKAVWRGEIRENFNIPNESIVLGFLARKTRDKGAFLMLEVFSRLAVKFPNIFLFFIGPDDSSGELVQFVASNPSFLNNVITFGSVSSHEKYLSSFDILCLPSYREGFGSIVIDAAALAIPTIGSRISGLSDAIIDGETGILFECGDVHGLEECLTLVLTEPGLIKKLGEASFIRVQKYFDSKKLAAELSSFYEGL
jgi:glycosyltransferase involved in cell wall biosynthesis